MENTFNDSNQPELIVVNPGQVRPLTSMVLSDNPQTDDAMILRLQYDLATKIHDSETIARRYGLGDKETLREYLRRHPQIVEGARKARAVMDSDQGAEGRVRLKALHATEALIIPTAGIAGDTNTPLPQRLDAFKQLSRVAGVDGLKENLKNQQANAGHSFVLNILFSGGESKHIEGTVLNNDQVVPPSLYGPDDEVDELFDSTNEEDI